MIEQNYLLDEIELEASDNISDNKKNCIYDILMDNAEKFAYYDNKQGEQIQVVYKNKDDIGYVYIAKNRLFKGEYRNRSYKQGDGI